MTKTNGRAIELEKLRKKNHLTRRQLSGLLEIQELTLYRWVHGLTKPHACFEKRLDILLTILRERK